MKPANVGYPKEIYHKFCDISVPKCPASWAFVLAWGQHSRIVKRLRSHKWKRKGTPRSSPVWSICFRELWQIEIWHRPSWLLCLSPLLTSWRSFLEYWPLFWLLRSIWRWGRKNVHKVKVGALNISRRRKLSFFRRLHLTVYVYMLLVMLKWNRPAWDKYAYV